MARRARRCNGKAFFQKTFTVHAFRVIFKDVCLRNIPLPLDGSPFLMAFAADVRDPHWRNGGVGVLYRNNIMIPVAIFAPRSKVVSPRCRLSVPALRVKILFLGVTCTALGALEGHIMRQFFPFQIGVTVYASNVSMDRGGKCFLVNKEGDLLPFARRRQCWIAVAR